MPKETTLDNFTKASESAEFKDGNISEDSIYIVDFSGRQCDKCNTVVEILWRERSVFVCEDCKDWTVLDGDQM